MIRKMLTVAIFLLSTNALSQECTPLKVKADGKNIILNSELAKDTSQVYLLKNNSKKSLWLDHPTNRPGTASAGWSTYLRADNWSGLVVNRKEFSISCAVIQPGHADNLNCAQAITVCASQKIVSAKHKGTYWLVEDKSWNDVVAAVNKISKNK